METLRQRLDQISVCLSIYIEHLPYCYTPTGIKLFALKREDVPDRGPVEAGSEGIDKSHKDVRRRKMKLLEQGIYFSNELSSL